MKNVLFIIALFTFVFIGRTSATATNIFSYNKKQINKEFKNLDELEIYVNHNKNVTLSELKNRNNPVVSAINFNSNSSFGISHNMEQPLGIPSFLWGCIFGWVGILIVALVVKDDAETKKALTGCAVSGGIIILLYVVEILIMVGSTN